MPVAKDSMEQTRFWSRSTTGCTLNEMLLESLVLAPEMFYHVLQLSLTDLCLIQQQSDLLLQLCQSLRQAVGFLQKGGTSVIQKMHCGSPEDSTRTWLTLDTIRFFAIIQNVRSKTNGDQIH